MYPRYVEPVLRQSLADNRVVLLTGPRQSGKTTLATQVAKSGSPYFTLDDPTTSSAAAADPVGFIRSLERATIDEIQRVPELVLAIKRSVDQDPRPGRFLLTGSANLLTIPRVADSLAGRMAVIDLMPLSVAEIHHRKSCFIDTVFSGKPPQSGAKLVGPELVEAVVAGGYPEALARSAWPRRHDWHLNYVRALVERDVRDLSQVAHLQLVPRLLRALAHHSGQLVNHSQLGASLGMNHVTTQKYAGLFEQLFLTRLLPPWSTNELKRLIKTPKIHFLDSGLLAALRDISPARIAKDRSLLGPLLESFVLSELIKLISWSGQQFELTHFRDKEQNEVDIVMENHDRQLIGIEVKSAASVTSADFAGLRRLAAAAPDRFVLGLVLYDEEHVVPFGPNLFAAPISALWN